MSVFTGGQYGRLAIMLNTLSSLNIEISINIRNSTTSLSVQLCRVGLRLTLSIIGEQVSEQNKNDVNLNFLLTLKMPVCL